MRLFKCNIIFLIAVTSFANAYAIETHTKLWTSTVINGSLSSDKKVKFYLEPDLRFVDNKYKFQQALFWMGLGYQFTPNLALYVGDAPVTDKTFKGDYLHSNIIWQQMNWKFFESDKLRFDNRNRLEEIKRIHDGPWEIVLRERLQLKYPFPRGAPYALVLSDEIFLDLKTVRWSRNSAFLAQNRAYAGITIQASKQTAFSIGYLNQYQFTDPNQLSNALVCAAELNVD